MNRWTFLAIVAALAGAMALPGCGRTLANDPAAHQPCPNQPTARVDFRGGSLAYEDVITEWFYEEEFRPGAWTQTDYNFETPSTNLLATEPTVVEVGGNTNFELYDYPGDHLTQPEGGGVAKLRMQEEESSHLVVSGSSLCRAFATGYKFDLKNREPIAPALKKIVVGGNDI